MTRRAFSLLLAFALLGLGASSISSWVHYRLLQDPSYTSFCDLNATVSCTEAYLSQYGTLFGTPVAIFGVLWFVGVLALILAGRPGRGELSENVPTYVFGLSIIGLVMVLYLAYAAFFDLRAVCLLCVTTYVAVIGLFIVSAREMRVPLIMLPERLGSDLRAAAGSLTALAVFVVFLALAGSAIAFFPKEAAGGSAPAAPAQEITAEQRAQVGEWFDGQPRKTVPADGAGAAVVVVKFNDYQCPACRDTYISYKPIFEKYEKEVPGKVRLVTKNFPLDPECNANTPGGQHRLSCEAAAAVLLARQHGNGEKLEDWLFHNQTTLTADSLKTATRDIGGVSDFDTRYSEVLKDVKADIELGRQLEIGGTPTFYVNGVLVERVSPQILDAIIEHALKAAPQTPS